MDDELPPEPLDNPRRLLVWPAPDVTTQQALSDRGYRPVIVHSREEVDAQIAAFPAALFVDPLTGPITRTALQSLRQAAVAAEVPVLVTAGLGQASREAAYGADPAVLLKALAPRDSEQHPPRVLLIEEHAEIALALTATLERRGMQVARAASDADAVTLAGQLRPNLVVMDLMQVHQRAGRDRRLAAGERAAQPHPARRLHGRRRPGGPAAAGVRGDGAVPRGAVHERRGAGAHRRPAGPDRYQLRPAGTDRCRPTRGRHRLIPPNRPRCATSLRAASLTEARRRSRSVSSAPTRMRRICGTAAAQLARAVSRNSRSRGGIASVITPRAWPSWSAATLLV